MENTKLGGGGLPLINLTLKKGTKTYDYQSNKPPFDYYEGASPFNFKPNEPFLKFLRQQLAITKFLPDALWENTRYVGRGIHPPII